jgi:tRNA G37 N-methylase Trm5
MLSYTRCNQCNGILPEDYTLEMKHQHFLFCSIECKNAREKVLLDRRIEQMKTHHPWSRMNDKEKEKLMEMWNITGPVVWNELTFAAAGRETIVEEETVDDTGKVTKVAKAVKKEKTERKCGTCGKSGHNARTCSDKKKKK